MTTLPVALPLDAFDTLPTWLCDLVDRDTVTAALVETVPELRSGALQVLGCDIGRLRMRGGQWSGRYELRLRAASGGPEQVLSCTGTACGPGSAPASADVGGEPVLDGWDGYLPRLGLRLRRRPASAELAALALLTDPDAARDVLERAVRTAGPAWEEFRLRSCTPRVARHHPGSRCTLLYTLDYPDDVPAGRWPSLMVAKAYSGADGQVAWEGMRALWQSPMRDAAVAIAEPLAFLPELNVLLQGPVAEETTLKRLVRLRLQDGSQAGLDDLRAKVRHTARGLAALHASGVRVGATRTWDDEAAEILEVAADLTHSAPDVARVTRSLVEALAAMEADEPAQPAAPCHQAFRPAQVLVQGDELGFIDFDGFCEAEPALDVAQFRAGLRPLGSGERDEAVLRSLADDFLAAYQEHAPVSVRRVALWQALGLLTQVLHCWTKIKPTRLEDALAGLRRQLADDLGIDV